MDLEGVFLQLADRHGGKGAPGTLVGMLTWRRAVGAAEEKEGRGDKVVGGGADTTTGLVHSTQRVSSCMI